MEPKPPEPEESKGTAEPSKQSTSEEEPSSTQKVPETAEIPSNPPGKFEEAKKPTKQPSF
jgi:hypothetical protein